MSTAHVVDALPTSYEDAQAAARADAREKKDKRRRRRVAKANTDSGRVKAWLKPKQDTKQKMHPWEKRRLDVGRYDLSHRA